MVWISIEIPCGPPSIVVVSVELAPPSNFLQAANCGLSICSAGALGFPSAPAPGFAGTAGLGCGLGLGVCAAATATAERRNAPTTETSTAVIRREVITSLLSEKIVHRPARTATAQTRLLQMPPQSFRPPAA